MIDVRVFGAKLDYLTDDTVAVQAAFNHAKDTVVARFRELRGQAWTRGISDRSLTGYIRPPTVFFPPGQCRIRSTIEVFPQTSVAGVAQMSQIFFEDTPQQNAASGTPRHPMKFYRDASYPLADGKRIMFDFLTKVEVPPSGDFKGGEIVCVDAGISELKLYPRANAIAINVQGTMNNFRIWRCVGFGNGFGVNGDLTSIFFNIQRRQALDPATGRPYVTREDGWRLTDGTRQIDGWNVDGSVSDCFVEGFLCGIFGTTGANSAIYDNNFAICRLGVRISNHTNGLSVSDNRFFVEDQYQDHPVKYGDVAISANGRAVSITGNRIIGYYKGIMAQGRGVNINGNTIIVSKDISRIDDHGYAIHCVTKGWRARGAKFGDGSFEKGSTIGGSHYDGEGPMLVTGNLVDFWGDPPGNGKLAPIYVEGHRGSLPFHVDVAQNSWAPDEKVSVSIMRTNGTNIAPPIVAK